MYAASRFALLGLSVKSCIHEHISSTHMSSSFKNSTGVTGELQKFSSELELPRPSTKLFHLETFALAGGRLT